MSTYLCVHVCEHARLRGVLTYDAHNLISYREELPFAVLVEALATKDIEVKAAVITFVNALLMNETGIYYTFHANR